MADMMEMIAVHGRWMIMWLLAGVIFLSAKCFMIWETGSPKGWRFWAYIWLWPGLDVKAWLPANGREESEGHLRWWAGLPAMILGLGLVRWAPAMAERDWLQGWIGMVGLILCLHFGFFRWLAFFWQRVGIPVKPIMKAPLFARSLSEFWGTRWNRGFRDFAQCCIGLPIARRWGRGAAFWSVFFFSGLVHEAVISVPAMAGFGWPVLYFIFQGLGIAAERRWAFRGRLWVLLMTGPAALLLFHPPFVERVMVPFLNTLRHFLT